MSPIFHQLIPKTAALENGKDCLEVHGVRITPSSMDFKITVEGITYRQDLTIRNVGKSMVTVTIGKPTSLAFDVKTVKRHSLPAGFYLTKEVTCVYRGPGNIFSLIPIYINEERFEYKLSAGLSNSDISYEPKSIDFGFVDINSSSRGCIFSIQNTGNTKVRFYIESGTYSLHKITIDPNKGHVQPKSSVQINVNLIGSQLGSVVDTIWLKCNGSHAIPITGEVIQPQFEPVCDSVSSDFMILEFPPTYVGAVSTRTAYVRNYSASAAMFCFRSEFFKKKEDKCCSDQFGDFNQFEVCPREGLLHSKEVKLFQFLFKPVEPKKGEPLKDYYLCITRVCRVKCKYLNASMFEDDIFVDNETSKIAAQQSESITLVNQLKGAETSVLLYPSELFDESNCTRQQVPQGCLTVYLHGTAVRPSVSVVPDEISLSDLTDAKQVIRVLTFINHSTKLPIIVNYKKVTFVEVEPLIHIEPNKSVEISVFITPRRLGCYDTTLQFELLHSEHGLKENTYSVVGCVKVPLHLIVKSVKKVTLPEINTGITPNYIKEVGKFCQNLRFNTMVVKPKAAIVSETPAKRGSTALIALPNDTQKSLRPWRGPKIKTIYRRVDRYIPPTDPDYELTVLEKTMKRNNISYYNNYIRQKVAKQQLVSVKEASEDYDIAEDKLICKDVRLIGSGGLKQLPKPSCEFVPLSPHQANSITITPSIVSTGQIAIHSRYDFKLEIQNDNPNPIRIYVKPEKPNMMFPYGNRKIIGPCSKATLPITYITGSSGYYTTYLSVIVNECIVFEVDVMADVSPAFLDLNTDAVEFDDDNIAFVEISNPLNADIPFNWSLESACFHIMPCEGVIKAYSKLKCQVSYLAEEKGPTETEAELLVYSSITKQLKLCVKCVKMNLQFVGKELEFIDMPLNIPVTKKVLLKNESIYSQCFSLVSSQFLNYATVSPMKGTIHSKSYAIITVTLKVTCCVKFSTKIRFDINNAGIIELPISGNVVYPNINITPNTFNFGKFTASTVSSIPFTLENNSNALARVKFDLSRHNDFKITEIKYHSVIAPIEELTLSPNATKNLQLHFVPTGSATDIFYLPLIINDIIGPASNDGVTDKVAHYLGDQFPDSSVLKLPECVPIYKVHIYATAPKLKFSKLQIFLNYKVPPYRCKNECNFSIFNPQKINETFCIRIDYLKLPFTITHVDGQEITNCLKSIKCSLPPQERVIFKISFIPEKIGRYYLPLPIYIQSDKSSRAHNVVYIEGTFEAPTITRSVDFNIYKPGPLLVRNIARINLYFNNHLVNCEAWVNHDLKGLETEIVMQPEDGSDRKLVTLTVCYVTEHITLTLANCVVSCTCGASTTVMVVVCRENCFLTNYIQVESFIHDPEYNLELRPIQPEQFHRISSLVSVLDMPQELKEVYEMKTFFAEYPFFPEDDAIFKAYLDVCVQTVENWVYKQGFFGRIFYELPIGFTSVFPELSVAIPPFIQLLMNLTGNGLEEYFNFEDERTNNDVERVQYLYTAYDQALSFLRDLGALFVCVRPELLLGYSLYHTYTENFAVDKMQSEPYSKLSAEDYYRLSKQIWLDILLQTYKVLVLNRLFFDKDNMYTAPKSSAVYEKFTLCIKKSPQNKHLFNNSEFLLMSWLEFHYNDIREKLWERHPYLEEREIKFYGVGMEDGFVYAAVTMAYCPYLMSHFDDMSFEPLTPEEILHNNIKVVESWRILNFSMNVQPQEIMNPHSMRTLFLMVYLYQMLPNLYPTETITLHAGLSQRSNVTYALKNTNSFPICYKVILYGKYSNCFGTDQEIYVVPPKKCAHININYWARFILQTTCTLILSGECAGYHYATTIAVTLIGVPDLTYITDEFSVQGNLYRVLEKQVKVTSPYHEAATYRMQFSLEQYTKINEVDALPYRDNLPNNLLYRVLPMFNDITCDNEGNGFLDLYVLCLLPIQFPIWIYFRNTDVGDFIIRLNTSCKLFVAQERLIVEVPVDSSGVTHRKKAFRTLHLQIPGWNKYFWISVAHIFSKMSGLNIEFWKVHAKTQIGAHILQKISIRCVPPHPYQLCHSTTFKIKPSVNSGVKLPKQLIVNNECSTDMIAVPLKIPHGPDLPKPFDLVLESTEGKQFRSYRITFEFARY